MTDLDGKALGKLEAGVENLIRDVSELVAEYKTVAGRLAALEAAQIKLQESLARVWWIFGGAWTIALWLLSTWRK